MITAFIISNDFPMDRQRSISSELGKLAAGSCVIARGHTADERAIALAASERPALMRDSMHCPPDDASIAARDAKLVAQADAVVAFVPDGASDCTALLAAFRAAGKPVTVWRD